MCLTNQKQKTDHTLGLSKKDRLTYYNVRLKEAELEVRAWTRLVIQTEMEEEKNDVISSPDW